MTADAAAAGVDARFHTRLATFALDAAFTAPAQGITGLFGPSGSGKTTILRCMAGLERGRGAMRVSGETWQDETVWLPPHQRAVGYVFQEASLFPHLDVAGNIAFAEARAERFARINGGAGMGRRPWSIAALADELGITHLLARPVAKLSGGERQRVALARALISQPRLMLMDEPLSAVDRASRDQILPLIEHVAQRVGVPIIYVSHDIGEMARLADTLVLVSNGRTVAQGATADVLERLDLNPATGRFEAGVVVTARVLAHDAAYHLTRLDLAGAHVTVPRADVAVGDQVKLRIRARDVALALSDPGDMTVRNRLPGRVVDVRAEADSAFAETLVAVGAGPDAVRLRARITRQAADELGITVGSDVIALVKSIAFDGRALIGLAEPRGTSADPATRDHL